MFESGPSNNEVFDISELCKVFDALLDSRRFGRAFDKLFVRLGNRNFVLSMKIDERSEGVLVKDYSILELAAGTSDANLFIFCDCSDEVLVEVLDVDGNNYCQDFNVTNDNIGYLKRILCDSMVLSDICKESVSYYAELKKWQLSSEICDSTFEAWLMQNITPSQQ